GGRGGDQEGDRLHVRLGAQGESGSDQYDQIRKETEMNRIPRMLTVALTVSIGTATFGTGILIAQQAPVSRTVLQQKDLEGVAGREVIMYRADVGPAGVAGRHHPPGPELFYVLEG